MNTESLKTFVLDILFPKICLACKTEGSFMCDTCFSALCDKVAVQKCPVCSYRNATGVLCDSCRKFSPLTRFLFALDYRDPIARDLVHSLKYNSVKELASPLGKLLASVIEKYEIPLPKTTLLVPVPLHAVKFRARGFNQAELIAKTLAEITGCELVADNVFRKANTQSQVEFSDFKERRKNMEEAFAVLRPEEFAKRRVLLVDDVSTSGATLDEVANVLRKAGAFAVSAIVVAKG